MATIWDADAVSGIRSRLDNLTPQHKPRWGRMNAAQMQVHVRQQIECALGQLELKPMTGVFRMPLMPYLIIHWLPWPKGAQTAPELVDPVTGDWDQERAALLDALEQLVASGPGGRFAEHPMFGVLKGREWGVLVWRHLDHHFRQFGI
jgi:hypothetical protein